MSLPAKKSVPARGFLLHITHYDPTWCKCKSQERPFDLNLGLDIIEAMSAAGLNLLVIDCADGVRYKSHPELRRKYTVPMSYLEKLVDRAREKGMEIVPKLNFSQSGTHRHNHWFRPHNELFDNDEYWKIAFELIDELIEVCRPRRFFHVGMDEDHDRAPSQYIQAVQRVHAGLKERRLRAVMWNDSALAHKGWRQGLVHAEKALAAVKKIPHDVVQVLWDYSGVPVDLLRNLVKNGFEVWGAPGQEPKQVLQWKELGQRYGGKGLLLTRWIPCRPSNRSVLLKFIRNIGPLLK